MGKLVPFNRPTRKKKSPYEKLGPPPDDAIEGANWLSRLLRLELFEVVIDEKTTAKERRADILRLGRAITQATPNDEIFQARQEVRADESEIEGETLKGQVSIRGQTKQPRRLRAKPKK